MKRFYLFAITLNATSGEYIIRNKWTTSRSHSLSVYADEIIRIKLSDAPALSVYGTDMVIFAQMLTGRSLG